MRAQEVFAELVDGRIWPFLRTHDFLRTRSTFHRRAGENWQVINLQRSTRSDARTVRFTANLGVALGRLRTGAYDWPAGRRPAEYRCHLRVRASRLLGPGDSWWELGPDTNAEALAEAVQLVLALYAVPWLDQHADEARLVALARDPIALREEHDADTLRWLARLMERLGDETGRRLVEHEAGRRHPTRRRA